MVKSGVWACYLAGLCAVNTWLKVDFLTSLLWYLQEQHRHRKTPRMIWRSKPRVDFFLAFIPYIHEASAWVYRWQSCPLRFHVPWAQFIDAKLHSHIEQWQNVISRERWRHMGKTIAEVMNMNKVDYFLKHWILVLFFWHVFGGAESKNLSTDSPNPDRILDQNININVFGLQDLSLYILHYTVILLSTLT